MKYKVNDIIIDREDNKRKIIEVFTQSYLTSDLNTFNEITEGTNLFLESELNNLGYTLYQEPKQKIVWGSPESIGEQYWYLDSGRNLFSCIWRNSKNDIFRLKTKNIFETEEECEARLKEIMES